MTGDTLCDAKRVISYKPTEFPAPCLSMAIVLKGKGDEAKIAGAMQRLIEEDPCISFENNVETKQQVVSGLGADTRGNVQRGKRSTDSPPPV